MTQRPAPLTRPWLPLAASIPLMMTIWLLWSGHFEPLLVTLGLVSCCIVALLSSRMDNLKHEGELQRLLLRFPSYWLWLSGEVVKSNLEVARLILSPRPALAPTIVTIDAASPDAFGQALLGNSITLTPGTLTLAIRDGRLHVHCLTRASAEALASGEMNRRVAALTRP